MTTLGYALSCEEFGPDELVRQAVRAQRAGFERLWISDHFHPWTDSQGHSAFVWSVMGALSQACTLPVYVQQIGPGQEQFFAFWESEIAPELAA